MDSNFKERKPMNEEKIQQMIEDGFPIKRIASLLKESEKEIKALIQSKKWTIKIEKFDELQIERICHLYQEGVSAKSLGRKFTIDKRRIFKWLEEKGIEKRNLNDTHRFTFFNQHAFDSIDTPQKAYWLGFFFADSYNKEDSNRFSLNLKREDHGHLTKLAKLLDHPIDKIVLGSVENKQTQKTYQTASLGLNSQHFCETMAKHGCVQAKSFIIKFPHHVIGKDLENHFIRGLFDGDGCLKVSKENEWSWRLVSTQECCESIQQIILREVGVIANFHCISETGNNTFNFDVSGNKKIKKIMDWLFKGVDFQNPEHLEMTLDRKREKFIQLQNQQEGLTFSRKAYRVSEEEKTEIKKEFSEQITMSEIASKHQIHPRTVRKILKGK